MPEPSSAVPRLLAPAQVAELLQIGVDEVTDLVHAGELRGVQVGAPARWRVEETSVEEYVAAQVEHSRRMALWRQSQVASFPEVWGASTVQRM